jgi:uncharacterized membrane protein YdjX (TVP38/TMEM64 family)
MRMTEFFSNIDKIINVFLLSIGIYGPILSCFLILVESMVPVLPLFVFITINFLVFGYFIGFIVSWVFTVLGCLISFFLFRKNIKTWFEKKISNNDQVKKAMTIIDKIKLESLTVIIAIPFTPAFLVNIAAGLSKIPFKKFLTALLIGKIFLVLFWGFVGTSLVESLTNPVALVKTLILLFMAFIISKIVSKKFNLD